MNSRRALLLVGSPRVPSTSDALGSYFLKQLAAANMNTAMLRIGANDEVEAQVRQAVDDSDLLLLSFPLYVDALPAGLLRILESLANLRRGKTVEGAQRLAAIVNCGLPESEQAEIAIAICRQFALEAGFGWAGALALGCGPAINGRALQQAGRAGRQAMHALDLAAAALANGEDIPAEAVTKMGALLLPKDLYVWFGTIDFKIKARADGAHKRLYDRPYRCASGGELRPH